jgi:hypothetical protein
MAGLTVRTYAEHAKGVLSHPPGSSMSSHTGKQATDGGFGRCM